MMHRVNYLTKGSFQTQRGLVLIDALVALGIFGVFVTTLLGSLSTGALGLKVIKEGAMAESLARSQMEYIKGQSYQAAGGYAIIAAPQEYPTSAATEPVSGLDINSIQRIVVTIYHSGEVIRVVEGFKVNR